MLFVLMVLAGTVSFAQTHKGISFQAVIKSPGGVYPTESGLTVNAKVLSPNDCVLWDEDHVNVDITDGYLNLVIGRGTVASLQPVGQTFTKVYNNGTAQTGLTCVNPDGSVSGPGSYSPGAQDGRKLRIELTLPTGHVLADFNLRSMPFAVNAENLNGKSDAAFVQVNGLQGLTQAAAEQWFSSTVLQDLLNGTYNAPSAVSAVNVTGTVGIANGGTGATTAAGARTNLGLGPLATMNPTGTADGTTFLRGDGSWQTVAGGVSTVAGKTGNVTLEAADISDFNTVADARI
ncbi:MAG TPA: cell wall anchor protein, partial [Pseudobdellovibrionaceae bacterium]|nr:cell wall anchor protein [Pseudobdellovibrionaceae bacterium]